MAVSNHCKSNNVKSSLDTFKHNEQKSINKKCKHPKNNEFKHKSSDSYHKAIVMELQ